MQSARAQQELQRLEAEKKLLSADLGQKIKDKRDQIDKLSTAATTGLEIRPVEVYERKNLTRGVWETVREDTREVVETRPLASYDTQLAFDDVAREESSRSERI